MEGKARKRVLKLARKISDESIVEYLTTDGTPLTNYYLYYEMIGSWRPSCGAMVMMIDDEVMATAITDYLQRLGAPEITSEEELEQLAIRNNWKKSTF